MAQLDLLVLELDFCLLERAGTRATLNETAEMDEQQRCCVGRRDRWICPAERKTARRHDPPVSLAEVDQQRCPRRPCACTDPDPPPSASAPRADGLGAGGAQSISGLPGRRAAPFAKSNRQEPGDRTSASSRKGTPARTDADDRFDDSRHLRRTLASNGSRSSGTRALSERRRLRLGRSLLVQRECQRSRRSAHPSVAQQSSGAVTGIGLRSRPGDRARRRQLEENAIPFRGAR